MIVGTLAGGGLMILGSILNSNLRTPVVVAGGLIVLVCVVIGIRAIIERYDAERREEAAGYTTVSLGSRYLWRLDPKTGVVIGSPDRKDDGVPEVRDPGN